MSEKQKIYEVVDVTDDEIYYTVGIFLDIKQAIKILTNLCDPYDTMIDGFSDDFCRIEIHEKYIGWCGCGIKVVWSRKWEKIVSDEDEVTWEVVE